MSDAETTYVDPLAEPWIPPEQREAPRLAFDPGAIFYDAPTGKYFVDVGTHFRTYTRKGPVVEGIMRGLDPELEDKEATAAAKGTLADVEIDHAVDWAGPIAGHRRGILRKNGLALLVTTEPNIPQAAPGGFPVIARILRTAFPEEVPRQIFCGWLAGGVKAVRSSVHQPAPMLVLAGGVNAGKSLLAWIAAQMLGGRVGHPFTAWTGALPWNDDLVGAELLLIDDSVGSTDMRARKALGARFKEAIYGGEVQVLRRHASAMSFRPVWRVLVACNDTPESLSIIPPLDDDLDDKVSMLHVHRAELPVDASTPEGKTELQRMIRAELPAFAGHLDRLELPEELVDRRRAGVIAWRDPELVQALGELSEEGRLEELLRSAVTWSGFNLAPGESRAMTAAELEGLMVSLDSPVREQAKALLGRYHGVCGRLLGKLERSGSELVSEATRADGFRRWTVTRGARAIQ